ncbi:MAG: sigma-70 family RNA polymerase sigma factor [Deltaproteobacteria bacterium]|nr:sigma-70 family RNA polymerase sigma factor [Deltaproteobacteria bacterium]
MTRKPIPANKTHFAKDYALTQAATAGDNRALRRLADKLLDQVRATSYYLTGGDPEFEDYAQLAIIEIMHSAGSYRGESPLKAWAKQITVRTVIRNLKQKRRRSQFVRTQLDYEKEVGHFASAEDEMQKNVVSNRLASHLGTLKPKIRVAITLKAILGYTVHEIVEITGTNPHTVDYRLRKGREQLRKKILQDPLLKEIVDKQGLNK